ncbi:VOC family protein [Deinococcus roseus]|uniref:Glyoxalase n=1 Tax=Deinococcus roseus TaxID=392414 RepID=A0ABQ2D375_9DEIO|nr:VOC family protein [Deinococcus roseus]GGJ40220.1 glyoxalase [Deinococcus roseus]
MRRIGTVHLNVKDLSKQLAFYQNVLGMQQLDEKDNTVTLGAPDLPLVTLHHTPDAQRVRGAGLYHFAVLLPSRADLGQFIQHIAEKKIPVQGASDHHVSEALYMADPEGNGIEIYRDRPEQDWGQNGQIEMTTARMDVEGVLRAAHSEPFTGLPAGTIMGHIHLHASNVPEAARFYLDSLKMEHIVDYPGAQFVSYDHYHHHVAVNSWAGQGVAAHPESLGLRSYGLFTDALPAGTTTDPSGIVLNIKPLSLN